MDAVSTTCVCVNIVVPNGRVPVRHEWNNGRERVTRWLTAVPGPTHKNKTFPSVVRERVEPVRESHTLWLTDSVSQKTLKPDSVQSECEWVK